MGVAEASISAQCTTSRTSSADRNFVGAGFEEFKWPRPVRADDELSLECEILEVRPSKSQPDKGLVKMRTTTLNQRGEAVQVLVGTLIVPRRTTQFA